MSAETQAIDSSVLDFASEVPVELRPRLERLTALRSAWSVLAPSGLPDNEAEIIETGRAVTKYFMSLSRAVDQLDPPRLAKLDARIDDFEVSMQRTASTVPVSRLRAALPGFLPGHRQGLLDLLDVFIGAEEEADRTTDGRIYAIDYLITLLCGVNDPASPGIAHDPVRLTPRLESLSANADRNADAALSDAVAEFFGASNLDALDLKQEFQQRTLRRRKADLGNGFFASHVLHAIVTYNAALFERAENEIVDSDEPVHEKGSAPPHRVAASSSVYASTPLRDVAAAIRRRIDGGAPDRDPVDRIAWALELERLDPAERGLLEKKLVGTRQDPVGTTIVVGLLARSAAVLSMDLQDAGIPPDDITDVWAIELGHEITRLVQNAIASENHAAASVLTGVKRRFLAEHLDEDPPAPVVPPRVTTAKPNAPSEEEDPLGWGDSARARESARELVRSALAEGEADRDANASRRVRFSDIPWKKLAAVATCLGVIGAGFYLAESQRNPDLLRMSSSELTAVSPYLDAGRRNGVGTGPAFVGTIGDEWLDLALPERERAAEELVSRLKARGLQQIMIYDDDEILRIQAVGTQPVRTL